MVFIYKLMAIVFFIVMMVGCRHNSNSCEVLEEEVNQSTEGEFGITPNTDGKQTITVFIEENPTEHFKVKLRKSMNVCNVDHIVYFINPDPVYTEHFDIKILPSIIIGGPNEEVLLQTQSLKAIKKHFE
ncbi:hypothetical protein [Bacillus suaedae]|uniref:Thioredoxin domain-containing protein n=1 Tax=Halalkalibacter suaedae TaxID=2822140 RepID=A0A940WUR1_9BACI|nr:hypothetical protein [Bacillus suaedae]MBP3953119.1 hypothetical protein [Bacillus suaedae]